MGWILHVVRSLDVSIYYFLSRFAGSGFLCRLARVEESNNLLKGAVFFALFWHQWFRDDGEPEKRRRDICAILAGSTVAIAVARTIAFLAPFRLRPMYDPAVLHPIYAVSMQYNMEHWSAFPSDTAAYFLALAIGIAYLSRRAAIPILLFTAGWICLPRVFLGVHYASDIVVGAAIGIAAAWLSLKTRLADSLIAEPAIAAANRSGSWFYPVAFLVTFEMATVFEGSRKLGGSVLHAAAAGLRFRKLGAVHQSSPIDTWGGLIGIAGVCLAVFYGTKFWRRKIPELRGRNLL